jgi:hypothetical protein
MVAALELIPGAEKAAYLEAKKQCPLLVETEPELVRFLEYDKFDVWSAARRLVKYWSIRQDLFEERAFLPMHQTGNGALSKVDLEVLSTGFVNLLHVGGSPIVCFVPSRLDKDTNIIISRRRCTFYIMSVIMKTIPASRLSFSAIMMLNQIGFQQAGNPTLNMVKELPIYPEHGVLAHCPVDVKRKPFFDIIVPVFIKLFGRDGSRYGKNGTLEAVSAVSSQHLAEKLVGRGYQRDSLPTECGGTWSVAKFRQWQLERKELERQCELVYFGAARSDSNTLLTPVAMVGDGEDGQCYESELVGVVQAPQSPLATLDELEKRWEWETLAGAQSQVPLPPAVELEQTLEWENPDMISQVPSLPSAAIEQKHVVNEKLGDGAAQKRAGCAASVDTMECNRGVDEALKADELHGSSDGDAEGLERKRLMDREYSKRKRAKRKARFVTLQESHQECIAENARLKRESTFLKSLLDESRNVIKCIGASNLPVGCCRVLIQCEPKSSNDE